MQACICILARLSLRALAVLSSCALAHERDDQFVHFPFNSSPFAFVLNTQTFFWFGFYTSHGLSQPVRITVRRQCARLGQSVPPVTPYGSEAAANV